MFKASSLLDTIIPDCSASMTNEKTFTLSHFRSKNLVLFFYLKNGTPGCVAESLQFRDTYESFKAANTEVFGISCDSMQSNEAFKAKLGLPFELISDADESLCKVFDVIKLRMVYAKKVIGVERSTFVIDVAGKLVKEWRAPKVPGHVDQVLAYVRSMA